MKVAHVVCAFPPFRGGMGNVAFEFARILSKIGHEVTVFTADNPSPVFFKKNKEQRVCDLDNEEIYNSGEAQIKEKFKIVRLKPLFRYGYAAFLPQLFWRLNNFDIIHLHYPFYGAAEIILLKKIFAGQKMKLIVHYHMDTIGAGLKGIIFKLHRLIIFPFLIKLADTVTCASLDYIKHSNSSFFYEKYNKKFRQTLFGVDLDFFKPDDFSDSKIAVNASPQGEKIILFVGGLDKAHYFKGLKNLLESVKKLENNSWKLLIVGEGDLRPYYEKLASELGVGNRMKFTGSASPGKLAEYYRGSYVLVLPSTDKSEAFGLVLLEAMASGTPVIASNLPGVRSVFKNGKEGLSIKPGDVNDLTSKLRAILKYEKMADEMGRAARELAEKKYSWDEVGERLNLIYYQVKYTPR